jgi:hypothetical protein
MKHFKIAAAFACFVCLVAGANARAETAASPVYAVMSLIGDNVTSSPYDGALPLALGRNAGKLDQHQYISLPIASRGFDDIALGSVAAAVRQDLPNATVDVLQTSNADLYKLQEKLFDSAGTAGATQEALQAMLKQRNADYLVVVIKHRTNRAEELPVGHMYSDADLRAVLSRRHGGGNGIIKLEGLGFYVDDSTRVQNLTSLDFANGVLVSYVDTSVRLVDAKTLKTVREVLARKREIIAVSRPLEVAFNAWDEAPLERKVKSLQDLIGEAMADAVPRLLNAPAP